MKIEPDTKITVINEQKVLRIKNEALLINAAKQTLRAEGVKRDIGINIVLADDRRIAGLNHKFLGRNGPTDVIAFGSKRLTAPTKDIKGFIGEIVLSVQTAAYNARQYGTTFEDEVLLYIIHGTLHLMGYDDTTNKKQKIMRLRQETVLKEVCRGVRTKKMRSGAVLNGR